MKASSALQVKKFQDIPNVGPAMERDFIRMGFTKPKELISQDAFALYSKLSKLTGMRQDPCVLDTYMAVVDFMNGGAARPWFYYTKKRKREFPDI